jgi:beta-glucosidase
LQPGESQTLVFTIAPRELASFDAASSSWVAEAGKYEIRVGASCLDIRQKAGFTLASDMVVEKVDKVLVPQGTISELKPR